MMESRVRNKDGSFTPIKARPIKPTTSQEDADKSVAQRFEERLKQQESSPE